MVVLGIPTSSILHVGTIETCKKLRVKSEIYVYNKTYMSCDCSETLLHPCNIKIWPLIDLWSNSSQMISTRLILGYLYEADSNIKSTTQSELWISVLLCWVSERYPCIKNSLSPYLNGWVRWVYSRRVVSGGGINHWKNSSFLHMTQSFTYSSLSAKGKPLAILIVQTCSDPACLWRKMVSAQILCSFYCL